MFRELHTATLAVLAGATSRQTCTPGQILFEAGDPGDALYVIASGAVEILSADGEVLATFEAVQCVGELALVSDATRSATVRIRDPSVLIRIPRAEFVALLEGLPELRSALGRILLRRLPGLRAATSTIFSDLGHTALKDIEAEMRWVLVARGETLFREGDAGDDLFVLLQGRLTALLPNGLRREMGRGEVVGEMALLGGEPRSATVLAERDSVLVGLSRAGFQRAVQHHPQALFRVAESLVKRVRDPAGRGQGPIHTLAILSLLDPTKTDEAIRSMTRSLDKHGSTKVLRKSDFLERFSEASLSADDAMRVLPSRRWLSELESAHRFLLYVADPHDTSWRTLALAEADRILLLIPPRAPVSEPVAQVVQSAGSTRTWVVQCHDPWTLGATGMAAWRQRLPGVCTLHVDSDFDSLARALDGRAVGLVLGGGGARAFAHIGVLRALEEASIPVDSVAGSSMGAFVAGALAAGMDWRQIRSFAHRAWAAKGMRKRWTLPVFSLLDVSQNEAAVRETLGTVDIIDLKIPFLATASDITTPALRVLDSGPLWRALRMSGAFPGLTAPVPDQGRIHVDGGMFNNLPIDVLRQRIAGPIVACDVGNERVMAVDPSLTESPGPRLRHLLGRRWRNTFPSFARVLIRTVECCDAMRSHERRALATHCFTPSVDHIALMDFNLLDDAIEVGFRHAADAIENGVLDSLLALPPRDPL